jgi:acyl-CoA thioesterase-1
MNDSVKRTIGSNLYVGIVFQILDILQYACGLKHDSALTLDPKAHFKKASRKLTMSRLGPMTGWILFASLLVLGCGQEPPVEKVASALPTAGPVYDGTIVAMGNSLTAGLGVPEDQAYPAQLARRLKAAGYNYRVVNAGISGETSSGALSRIRWVVSSLKPDIVILETGANDGLRGLDPELLETNLDQLVGFLAGRNIQVILAGMRMLPNLGPAYSQAFDDIYPRIAAKHGVIFIPFFLEGVAGRPDLNQDDRLHPNADGYARIVNTVYPHVVAAIGRRTD